MTINKNNKAGDQNLTAGEGVVLESVPIERVEQYLNTKYNFRRNVVTGKTEYRLISSEVFTPVTENCLNSLWLELTKARKPCSRDSLKHLLQSNFSTPYDPFLEYINGLPVWEEQTDYIEQLAGTVVTNDSDFWKFCLKKWIVAMVGAWIRPEIVNQTAIVFSGGQGIGKTTWIDNLVPPALRQYYFSGTINPNNKDTLIQLSECCIINLDELENLNRSEVGTLKEVITKSVIRLRRAYGIDSENFIRRASFAGSVNASQFLNDTTGSRRFLCFEVTAFHQDHGVEIDNVYSQALALFNSGFRYWFNGEEIRQLEQNNDRYRLTSIEEELLVQQFEAIDCEDETCEYLSATEVGKVLESIFKVPMQQGRINRLGKVMHKLGYSQIKKRGILKYCVKRKPSPDTGESFMSISA